MQESRNAFCSDLIHKQKDSSQGEGSARARARARAIPARLARRAEIHSRARGPPTSVIPSGPLARRIAPIWKSAKISRCNSRESYRRWIPSFHARARARASDALHTHTHTHDRHVCVARSVRMYTVCTPAMFPCRSTEPIPQHHSRGMERAAFSSFLFPTSFLGPRLRWVGGGGRVGEHGAGEVGRKRDEREAARPPARYDTARFFDDR